MLVPVSMSGAGVTKISRAAFPWVEEMAFDGVRATTPATPGRVASYSGVTLPGMLKRMEATFSLPQCQDPTGMCAVLISHNQGLETVDDITASCLHVLCTQTDMQVTRFDDHQYYIDAVIPFDSPLVPDTLYTFWVMPFLNYVSVKLPTGSVVDVPMPGALKRCGDKLQFEAYRNQQNAGFATFTGVSGEW